MSRAIPLFGVREPCMWGCCPGGIPEVPTRKQRRWVRRAEARERRRKQRREQRA